MPPMENESNDLSSPGALDALLEESENLLDEGQEDVPEDECKANAAYARQRKALTTQSKIIKQLVTEREEAKAAKSQAAQAPPAPASTLDQTRQAYQVSVYNRAVQRIGRPVDMNSPQDYSAIQFEMQQVMIGDRFAQERIEQAKRNSGTVLSSVFSEFPKLDEADKGIIKKVITDLPAESQADAGTIRKEVYSYLGRNLDKFTTASSEEEKKTTPRETALILGEGGEVREITPPKKESKRAGAAVTSGLKGGSAGVKIASPSGETKKVPTMSKDDRKMMRERLPHLDPANPKHIEIFLKAKRTKEDKYDIS